MKGWGVDFGVCDVLVCVHDGVLVSDDGRRKGCLRACLAQSVERKTLNLVVVGSSPTVGTFWLWTGHPWDMFLHTTEVLCVCLGHTAEQGDGRNLWGRERTSAHSGMFQNEWCVV